MACFNLQIGDRTYKFVNNDFSFGESENSLQGWDSFVSFLTTGDLHDGKLIDDSGNVIEDISEFFNSAIETLRDCGDTIVQMRPKDGITASGTQATAGRTIAAPRTFAFGTKIMINGHVYTVEDRGGAIQGNRIDIYFDTHEEALKFGVKNMEIFKVIE